MPPLWRDFVINGCWILSKSIFCFNLDDHMVFTQCGISHWLMQILKNPCNPEINPRWSCCMILSMYCWIQSLSILSRIFTSMFISDIVLFFLVSFSDIGISVMVALEWIREYSFICYFLEQFQKDRC